MRADFDPIMGMLYNMFGDDVTVYPHDGYDTGSDDFWHEDQDWSSSGTSYPALFENEISDETAEQGGFAEEAESAVWLRDEHASEGDRVDYQGNSYVVVSTNTFRSGSNVARQLLGVKAINV